MDARYASESMVTLQVGGQTLLLLPEKVIFLPEDDALLVADIHVGKAVSFRRMGVPVPSGTTDENLSKLSVMIERLAIRRVIFLGDFLHSSRSLAPTTLATVLEWRELHPDLELTLVRGNHDIAAGDPPASLGIDVVDEPLIHGDLALCHHPRPIDGKFVLAGHVHPCVTVAGRAHDVHRLPCFWFTPRMAVLPAFGAFTGMQTIRAAPGEQVYATTRDRVFELRARGTSRMINSRF